jgi:multiple antibiotic resistance protein
MLLDFASSALATLMVILDPVGLGPIFLSMTRGMTAVQRRGVAIRACLFGGGTLLGSGWLGA